MIDSPHFESTGIVAAVVPVRVRSADYAASLQAAVVVKQQITALPRAARGRGCWIQVGADGLFEQVPLYLELFGSGKVAPDELRAVAMLA
jgi:shikimate dehydrogenase